MPKKRKPKKRTIKSDDFDDRKLKRYIEKNFDECSGAAMPLGFANAFVGISYDERSRPVMVYDVGACVKILMDRDEMTLEEAQEFFEFNVAGAKFGDDSHPMFINVVSREEWAD